MCVFTVIINKYAEGFLLGIIFGPISSLFGHRIIFVGNTRRLALSKFLCCVLRLEGQAKLQN